MATDREGDIERICHEALALDASAREAFVADACAGDEALRREVWSLVSQAVTADEFLREPALVAAAQHLAANAGESLIGRTLGAYEIHSLLGAGGMGEVYRARDAKLNRDVAIKILPRLFIADPERLARFEREARMLAALNHPHIGAIYGLEDLNGVPALVLELVEGPTLGERLASGPLPAKEALVIARQVAEALEAAHARGIVHRDLKPANIKFTGDGAVKVLDFGLAKAILGDTPGSDRTKSSPEAAGVTREGLLLGTIGYMSPEQATGRPSDKRTDIWAFGCIVFEMLTGRRAFEAQSLEDTLAAMLTREPDWQLLPPHIPVAVRRLVQRCLERDPHRRIADVAAIRFVLEDVDDLASGASSANATAAATSAHAFFGATWWRIAALSALTFLLGAALVAGLMKVFVRPLPPPAVTRTTIVATELPSLPGNGPVFALSPDGARVVYVGKNGTQLFVRALDTLQSVPIAMGTRLGGPFVSPDGDWVGFFDGLTLKKVRMTGGTPIPLLQIDATGSRGATWVTDDTIVMATDSVGTGLLAVPALGGTPPTVLTWPDHAQGESQHLWPQRLPGGHAVLFTITSRTGGLAAAQIAVLDLSTRTRTILLRGGSQAQYVASGHMVYAAGGTLRAVPFDVGRLKVLGADALVVPRLLTASTGGADFAIAENGTLLYRQAGGSAPDEMQLVFVDRMSNEEPIAAPPRAYKLPRLSHDGTRLALDIRDQENDIWIWDFRSPGLRQLTIDPSTDRVPEWTLDDERIVFTSNRGGMDNLWWQPANGTGAAEPLITNSNVQLASGTTPDGGMVLFDRVPGKKAQLMQLALDGSRRLTPLLLTTSFERNGIVSRDGRWIAYESYRSDPSQSEIYVRPFPKTDAGYWKISMGGGTRPLWAPNGDELFYVGPPPSAALMSVPVDTGGSSFHHGTPVTLLQGYATTTSPSRTYDVASDGRFVMIKPSPPDQTAAPSLILVQHFDEELKRVAPPSGSR